MSVHDKAYGWAHRQRRRRLIREAIGMPCPFCLRLMLDPSEPGGEPLHLDHSDPAAKQRGEPGDRIAHAACNIRAGNGSRRADWNSVEW